MENTPEIIVKKPKSEIAETNATPNKSSEKNASEIDPIEQKTDELENAVDALKEHAGEGIEEVIKNYLPTAQSEKNKDEKSPRMVETLAELTRLLALIMAMLAMYILNPKEKYSGEDLKLSEDSPEREEKLAKAFLGEDNQKSWKKFREDVQKLPELPFDAFMAAVLEANMKHPVRGLKIKENGQEQQTKQKMLRAKRQLFGRRGKK